MENYGVCTETTCSYKYYETIYICAALLYLNFVGQVKHNFECQKYMCKVISMCVHLAIHNCDYVPIKMFFPKIGINKDIWILTKLIHLFYCTYEPFKKTICEIILLPSDNFSLMFCHYTMSLDKLINYLPCNLGFKQFSQISRRFSTTVDLNHL